MARRSKSFNFSDLDISPEDIKRIEKEIDRKVKSKLRTSASKSSKETKKLIAETTKRVRAEVLERVRKVKAREQARNLKRFLKSAEFPKDKTFRSGFGIFKRLSRFRGSLGDFSKRSLGQFFGSTGAFKVEKTLQKFSQLRKIRLRQAGAALGIAAIGFAISRNKTGVKRKKRSVGRPRFSRQVGRPKLKRRVGRPSFKSRR